MIRKATNYLYIATILFFLLGFFNMLFAWMGLMCMILPFLLLAKDKSKTWCHKLCPRAKLFTVLFRGNSITGRAAPRWLTHGKAKWFVLGYFCVNLFVMALSTVMVFNGKRDAMEAVRFLIAFQFPWEMPQLLEFGAMPGWAIHFAFRFYSMMLTTTVIGIALGWVYKPRTWCAICPVNTISSAALKNRKPNQEPEPGV